MGGGLGLWAARGLPIWADESRDLPQLRAGDATGHPEHWASCPALSWRSGHRELMGHEAPGGVSVAAGELRGVSSTAGWLGCAPLSLAPVSLPDPIRLAPSSSAATAPSCGPRPSRPQGLLSVQGPGPVQTCILSSHLGCPRHPCGGAPLLYPAHPSPHWTDSLAARRLLVPLLGRRASSACPPRTRSSCLPHPPSTPPDPRCHGRPWAWPQLPLTPTPPPAHSRELPRCAPDLITLLLVTCTDTAGPGCLWGPHLATRLRPLPVAPGLEGAQPPGTGWQPCLVSLVPGSGHAHLSFGLGVLRTLSSSSMSGPLSLGFSMSSVSYRRSRSSSTSGTCSAGSCSESRTYSRSYV